MSNTALVLRQAGLHRLERIDDTAPASTTFEHWSDQTQPVFRIAWANREAFPAWPNLVQEQLSVA